ncbi:MAG TPA: rhomboid family intramembrane serine protease [Candidatus Lokiarchaeia archaeon]|nr:rhomboid family intramembrane serine protease [Candidatus Lokiarchaeia archaeon]
MIFINVFVFLVINVLLGEDYLLPFAQNNILILQYGEWWRLFTANWVHADILHIASNMVALLIFGLALENTVKKWQYLAIYLVSGFFGNVASLFLSDPYVYSLGASGCIFGVLAASFVVNRRLDPTALIMGIIFTIFFIILSIGPDIDVFAHIFGAAGGLLFGYAFSTKSPEERFKDVY